MNKKNVKIERWQLIAVLMMIYDIIAVNIAYASSLWLRFELHFSEIPDWYWQTWESFTPIYTAFCIIIFWLLRMYGSIWKFASVLELVRVVLSSIITGVFHIAAITMLYGRMPLTYYVLGNSKNVRLA